MISFSIKVNRPTIIIEGSGELGDGITVLTGKSGSGKSTLIKAIAGLVKPHEDILNTMITCGWI